MRTIEKYEKLQTAEDFKKAQEEKTVEWAVYHAYEDAKESGNDLLDFNEVIWEDDIKDIIKELKEIGEKEFTISSNQSSLIKTLAILAEHGASIKGLTKAKDKYPMWNIDKRESHDAIHMTL